jgi:zinc D-Ala-D-Ala carboxypeptidase
MCTLTWRFWGVVKQGTGIKMNKAHFFTEEEVKGLDQELIAKLDWARGRARVPFIITSGYRNSEENKEVDGKDNSAHMKGLAVDLRVQDSVTRFKMVNSLLLAGFKRIGVYTNHVHVDLDGSLPQEVMWTGTSH